MVLGKVGLTPCKLISNIRRVFVGYNYYIPIYGISRYYYYTSIYYTLLNIKRVGLARPLRFFVKELL